MSNPELGTKRECPACSARFYDLKKNPAVCPKCAHETVFDGGKAKRVKAAPKAPPVQAAPKKETADDGEIAPDDRTISLEEMEEGQGADKTADDDVDAELLALGDDNLDDDAEDESDVFLEDDDDEGDDVSGLVKSVASDD